MLLISRRARKRKDKAYPFYTRPKQRSALSTLLAKVRGGELSWDQCPHSLWKTRKRSTLLVVGANAFSLFLATLSTHLRNRACDLEFWGTALPLQTQKLIFFNSNFDLYIWSKWSNPSFSLTKKTWNVRISEIRIEGEVVDRLRDCVFNVAKVCNVSRVTSISSHYKLKCRCCRLKHFFIWYCDN